LSANLVVDLCTFSHFSDTDNLRPHGKVRQSICCFKFHGDRSALAEFDIKATPLEQFGELLDAIHARKGN